MKDLHNGSFYWPTTMAAPREYPALAENAKARAVVIGGGMAGALMGRALAGNGFDAMLLEQNRIAAGSTSANTGLLQFSNDIMLTDLIAQIGEAPAVRFYRACRDAVVELAKTASETGRDVEYRDRSSLYYASTEQDLPKLAREYEALAANGFDVEFWEPEQIARHFPFRKPGAIVTHGDGEINPFRFVQAVMNTVADNGLRVFEHTAVTGHETLPEGTHRLRTSTGHTVEADYVVYSIGYEPEQLRGRLVKPKMSRSFAVVTEPMPEPGNWHGRWLIWETARPYLYMRTSADGRIVAGGLDETAVTPYASEAAIYKQTGRLYEQVRALLGPDTPPVAYAWNALFAESQDNLPFIGEDPARKGVYYMLGYGGNGDVYCMMGAGLLLSLIRGEPHPIADLVRLGRPSLVHA
ncbi:NAD(P)/FAD-dependent oxidoreductase [Paenibacillus methanolicus]|uniref:Glycine/D-amino acid oxidase-like deaminating enzyme n=1 Tax=Paenibacillus methanolicus TaxID=582686 RepID=A0A5S5BVH2_9BACL|nr:FAD-dependent oxidoreductase [Paenibacillus methanolicus]TYP70306.1 glycine/D-amino acid oxidase-like deaminating enzyme [Paenibacillus methanolicus]